MSVRISFIGGGSYQWIPKLLVDFARTLSPQDAEIVIEDIDPRPAPDMVDFVHHIARELRNIPVMLGIAADMEELCPDAWLLNLTNPMTTLMRAVLQETSVYAIGLCHEVTITLYGLAIQLSCDLDALRPTVAGVKLELFERYGVLPAAGDRHLVEFLAGFLTRESVWRERWSVALTSMDDRRQWLADYTAEFEQLCVTEELSDAPSGELVAEVIDSHQQDRPRDLPPNIANHGQVPDRTDDVVVESMVDEMLEATAERLLQFR
jgi:alpha-galactosidase/6-phospho-beta-glucosidase family protein